jgi:hypothetical protein
MRDDRPVTPAAPEAPALTLTEQAVLDAIRATPYGSVEVVLHQARIVQVVRTQKLRLDPGAD